MNVLGSSLFTLVLVAYMDFTDMLLIFGYGIDIGIYQYMQYTYGTLCQGNAMNLVS